MTLQEALTAVDTITVPVVIEEQYLAQFYTTDQQNFLKAVDFRLAETIPDLPLTDKDITFVYQDNLVNIDLNRGETKTNIFYPIGQSIKIYGSELIITGYGEITYENIIPTLHIHTTSNDMIAPSSITDTSKEIMVKDNMTTILRVNNMLRDLLPAYNYNWLDYTEDNISKYVQYNNIYKILSFQEIDDRELRYLLADLDSLISYDGPTPNALLVDKITSLANRFNNENLELQYYQVFHWFNSQSLIKWFIHDLTINYLTVSMRSADFLAGTYSEYTTRLTRTQAGYITHNNDIPNTDHLTIYLEKETTNGVVKFIFKPELGEYNYRLELGTIQEINVDDTYYNYEIGSVNLYKINTLTDEVVSLTLVGNTNFEKAANGFIQVKHLA